MAVMSSFVSSMISIRMLKVVPSVRTPVRMLSTSSFTDGP